MAGRGSAWPGVARLGKGTNGAGGVSAISGRAWRGEARQGKAWQGKGTNGA